MTMREEILKQVQDDNKGFRMTMRHWMTIKGSG